MLFDFGEAAMAPEFVVSERKGGNMAKSSQQIAMGHASNACWVKTGFTLLFVVLFLTCGVVRSHGSEKNSVRGNILLIGGGSKPDQVIQLFIRLAGGKASRIVILPLASGDPEGTGDYYFDLFKKAGAVNLEVLHIRTAADAFSEPAVQSIERAGGIWFSGGDQSRITSLLLDTPVLAGIKRMYANGGVVGGTSAGTACQCDPMITGSGGSRFFQKGNVPMARGLGLVSGIILDQHYFARHRHQRLLEAVLANPSFIGIGVDEATAIWINANKTLRVLGESYVEIIDARRSRRQQRKNHISATGVTSTILAPGDSLSLKTF